MKTRLLIITGIVLSVILTIPNVLAEEHDVLEELVNLYEEIAEKNVNAMQILDNLQQELDIEMKKPTPDISMIENLQKLIDEQYVIIRNTEIELLSIQAKITEGSQMDPNLKLKLEDTREVLRENQEIIPWTGLGVSNSEQAVMISIDAENPEEFRSIIEELVGQDIPVIIKKGGNPYMREMTISPLKQFMAGVAIDKIQCKPGLEHTIKINDFKRFYCTSPDTKQILIKRGWAFDESKACRNPIDCFDSGVTIDRTGYPEPEPVLNEDGTVSENNSPYTWYDISGVKQIYRVGEQISFTETVQGYDNPCVSPHYEILDGNTLEPVWEYKVVYPCPFIKEPQQFKKINKVPDENIVSPILNQTGPYIFRSYHSYSDGFSVKTFSVVGDSFTRNTIDPCNVVYDLDANDYRKKTAPPMSIESYGRDAGLEPFGFDTSIGKIYLPSYMPPYYEPKSHKIKDDLNTLVYYPRDLAYDDTITVTKIIQEGIIFLISDTSQTSQQWSNHVAQSVRDEPDIQSSEVFRNQDVLLVHGIPSKDMSSTLTAVIDDKQIQIISTKLDIKYLMNVFKSMFED